MKSATVGKKENYSPTRNACKLCTPLGASLVFKGISGAVPLLHGSQGCSTYIRRYVISHFKEPADIASTNFSEHTAIFGGGANLNIALDNLRKQYDPKLIGIATTCLSETIGDDVPMFLRSYRENRKDEILPSIVHVSTPSYRGTHMDGFHGAVLAAAQELAGTADSPDPTKTAKKAEAQAVNVFPGMVSPADIRHLKEIFAAFGLPYVMLPDYSDRLDGGLWSEYQRIQKGGTPVEDLRTMGSSATSLEFGRILASEKRTAATFLEERFGVPAERLGLPIGVRETDALFDALEKVSGRSAPAWMLGQRARLIDSFVDGHKYLSGLRAAVYGEEDLVVGLVSFLREVGVVPVLCASGGRSGRLESVLARIVPEYRSMGIEVRGGADFMDVEEEAARLRPDVFVGSSKGYAMARRMGKPLVRVGFPIHDRIGGARLRHLGYEGAQQLFDRLVNAVIECRQENSDVGYSYM